jgi:hypothetical protein
MLAHVARSDSALSKHLWTARQRALHAYCGEGRHAVAGAWAEEPLGGSKSWPTLHEATPRPQTKFAGAAAYLAGLLRVLHVYCGKEHHAVAGAWSEGPLG